MKKVLIVVLSLSIGVLLAMGVFAHQGYNSFEGYMYNAYRPYEGGYMYEYMGSKVNNQEVIRYMNQMHESCHNYYQLNTS